MYRLLGIFFVLLSGVFGLALIPSQSFVTPVPLAELPLAETQPYQTLLASTNQSITPVSPIANPASINETNDINARFAGLLAHIRWLFDQEDTTNITRRIDRDDSLVWRQIDSLMDNNSEDFRDLGEEFDTSVLTVGAEATITGDLTVAGTTTLASLMADSLRLPSLTPTNTTNLLYNTAGDLYWQGNLIAGGTVGNWVSNGGDVYRLTGNVGIGTSSPDYLLDVAGFVRADDGLVLGGGGELLLYDAGSNRVGIRSGSSLDYKYFTFDANGDFNTLSGGANFAGAVGIGTSTPNANLTIDSGTLGVPGLITLGGGGQTVGYIGNAGSFLTPGAFTDLGINSATRLLLGTSGVTALTIDNNRNIGIGTTSPRARLDVAQISAGDPSIISQGILRIENPGDVAVGNGIRFWKSPTEEWSIGGSNADGVLTDDLLIANRDSGAWSDRFVVTASGNVGIGTTTPTRTLDVFGTLGVRTITIQDTGAQVFRFGSTLTGGTNQFQFFDGSNTNIVAVYNEDASQYVSIDGGGESAFMAGNVGIATTTPSAVLTVSGTVRFATITGGTLQTDALGNVTASSDERLKDIDGEYTAGLEEILGLEPIQYNWTLESGFDTETLYAGFSAQNVQEFLPAAVGQNPDGFLTLSDRPIIAALVNAVKEMWDEMQTYFSRTEALEREVEVLRNRLEALENEGSSVSTPTQYSIPEPVVSESEPEAATPPQPTSEPEFSEPAPAGGGE